MNLSQLNQTNQENDLSSDYFNNNNDNYYNNNLRSFDYPSYYASQAAQTATKNYNDSNNNFNQNQNPFHRNQKHNRITNSFKSNDYHHQESTSKTNFLNSKNNNNSQSDLVNFLSNPKIREILVLHNKLRELERKEREEVPQTTSITVDSANFGNHLGRNDNNNFNNKNNNNCNEIIDNLDLLLLELFKSNVSVFNNSSHLVHLLRAYQSIATEDFYLPNLNDFNRQMDAYGFGWLARQNK